MPVHIGSVSTGTLRDEDLIEAFASELARLLRGQPRSTARMAYDRLLADAQAFITADDDLADDGSEIINDLQNALNDFAPAYCYFGTLEGDGADFGFWPSMESIAELPRCEDSDDAKALGEDCLFVNDHGNVTVFGGDGSVILELV